MTTPLTKVRSHCLATGHLRRSVFTINCGHPFIVKQSTHIAKLFTSYYNVRSNTFEQKQKHGERH